MDNNKHSYPFARLFIRLAMLLAALVVLAGLSFAAGQFISSRKQLAAVAYAPGTGLENQAKNLEKNYLGTSKRVQRSLDIDQFPAEITMVDFAARLPAIQSANPANQARQYAELASQTDASVEQIKEFHISEFVKALESLRAALLAHAARLRQQYATPATAQPSPSTPAASAAVQAPASTSFRIFADPPQADRSRQAQITRVKEFLDHLRSQSKREESLDQIRRATIYLARAESLLDLLEKPEEQPASQPTTQPSQAEEQANQENLVARSEREADQISKAIDLIRDQIYTNWQVQLEAQRLEEAAGDEMRAAEAASQKASQIQAATFQSIGLTLASTLALAFLIMVVADFLRAFLNLSNNTDKLVDSGWRGQEK